MRAEEARNSHVLRTLRAIRGSLEESRIVAVASGIALNLVTMSVDVTMVAWFFDRRARRYLSATQTTECRLLASASPAGRVDLAVLSV